MSAVCQTLWKRRTSPSRIMRLRMGIRKCMRAWLGLALLFSATSIQAIQQSEKDAAEVVAGWLATTPQPLGAAVNNSIRRTIALRNAAGEVIAFVITLAPGGFVVASPDNDLEPILSFSATGSFDPGVDNPLAVLLQRDVTERLARVRLQAGSAQLTMSSVRGKWARLAKAAQDADQKSMEKGGLSSVNDLRVAPFLQSKWSQRGVGYGSASAACYNYYTPPYAAGTANNYPCGCNNTAYAQIMRYYSYPVRGVGTGTFSIRIDGVTATRQLRGGDGKGGPYAWDLMELEPDSSTPLVERQAIGALTADIGVASGTSYASGGSAAWSSPETLKSVFYYSNVVYGNGLGDQFVQRVHPNLDAKFPVMVGLSGDGGHAVVCDGYGYNGGTLYHHLNLGWGGLSDAWYNLPDVAATPYHFTVVDGVAYNIFPTNRGEIISGRVVDTAGVPIPYVTVRAETGTMTYSAQGDGRGIYALTFLPARTTFTISVSKKDYQFPSQTATTGLSVSYQTTGNRWGVNFTGTKDPNSRIISGLITNSAGAAVSGVAISFSNGGGTVYSDASGLFFNTVPAGWSGTATPAKGQYVFTPASRTYGNVTTNVSSEGFLGAMVMFVNASATGANNGVSWTDAFTDLQSALALATNGTELWVAQGVYRPGTKRTDTFQCKEGVALYGGFSGSETTRSERDWRAHVTELSGDVGVQGSTVDNAYHVVSGISVARIDGFRVTGGNADGDNWEDRMGAGVAVSYGETDFTVANCDITGNSAADLGGGVCYATVMDSVFRENRAPNGGAAFVSLLVNCLVVSNTAASLGGGCYDGTNINCTFVGNWAHYTGGGLYGGSATNCILFGNSTYFSDPNYSDVDMGYCSATPLPKGPGNLAGDPCFRSVTSGDFRPRAGSPVIDKGLNAAWMAGAVDLAGEPRIVNETVDMGAYEVVPTDPRLSCNVQSADFLVLAGETGTGECEIWNSGVGTLFYSLASSASWLKVSPMSGASTGERDTIRIEISAVGMAPGRYLGEIAFNSTNAVFTQSSLPVSLRVPEPGSLVVTLVPADAVADGARWQVDGGVWRTNGALVSGLSSGEHVVTFNALSDWISPGSQAVTITTEHATRLTGTYLSKPGALQVSLVPTLAVDVGAKWQVDGGPWQESGATAEGLSSGEHTVGFRAINGWTAPAVLKAVVGVGSTLTLTGTYVAADLTSPVLTVTSPKQNQQVSNAVLSVTGTAMDGTGLYRVWCRLNNDAWVLASGVTNWSSTLSLTPGTNYVQAYAMDLAGNLSATTTVRTVCVLSAPVGVQVVGRGTVSPNVNGKSLTLGKEYTLTARPSTGFGFLNWSSNLGLLTHKATVKFVMQSNLVLTANFIDTAKPTLSIALPKANQQVSNALFTATGKAADNAGVAGVWCQISGKGWVQASGTTNWSCPLALSPGTNLVEACALDAAGNRSITNKAKVLYVLSCPLELIIVGQGAVTPDYRNKLLPIGKSITLTAKATKGSRFTGWTGSWATTKAAVTFTMASNLTLIATFVDTNRPANVVIYPAVNAKLTNQVITATGKASDNVGVSSVWYQFNSNGWYLANTTNRWTNWFTAPLALSLGTNVVQAVAGDEVDNLSLTNTVKFLRR